MTERNEAFIALGANLGKPREAFAWALAELEAAGVEVVRVSGLWRSAAWPEGSGAPDYLNAVAKVRAGVGPEALLALLHAVEARAGRVRGERNAPRVLDLDLVSYEAEVREGELVLPHPRVGERAFVLLPMWEVEADWVHPVTGEGVWEMMGRLGSVEVERVTERWRGAPIFSETANSGGR